MTVVSKVQLLSDERGKLKDASGFSTATALLSEHRLHVKCGVISGVGYSGKLVVAIHQSFLKKRVRKTLPGHYISDQSTIESGSFCFARCHFTLTRRVSLLLFDFGHAIKLS